MDDIFKVIDTLNFTDIFNKQNKIYLVESLIKSTTIDINKNINNNTINMIWNEVCTINNLSNIIIEPVNNNLLNLKVKLIPSSSRLINEFDNKKLKKEIIIKLTIPISYPNNPHTVTIKYPKFDNNLNYNIKASDYFKDNLWNPTNTIEYTIQNLQNIIENYGIIYNDKFIDLQSILEKLSITCSVSPKSYEPITIHNIPIKKISKTSTWATGTGYGSSRDNSWNINNYLNNEKKKNEKIIKYLNKLLKLEELDINIINKSCLIKYVKETLYGVQILDILENNNKFLIIFQIIKKYDFIVDDDLLTILCNLKNEFKNYIEILEKNNELSDITKVKELFNYLVDYNKENTTSLNNDNDEYISVLKDIQFDSYPIYEKGLTKTKPHIINMRRVLQEIQGLSKSLPINKESSIFVKYDEENLGLFRFLITGPKDTPYQDGCFLFEMILKDDYPNTPPHVHILTTGYGKVRFNPNLYASGKVCLSLLGTWTGNEGEQWNPKTSTLLQILVSIQSLIFTDKPYFNEPGYENNMNTEAGKKASEDYNKSIQTYTQKWAIENMIKNPPEDFKEIIIKHFQLKKIEI
jgi:ubiquitin-protein ligase